MSQGSLGRFEHFSDMVQTRDTGFRIEPIDEVGAGEVVGLNCGAPFDAPVLRAIEEAFAAYPILVFRDQRLDPRAQVAFTRQFGELEVSDRSNYAHPDAPEVLVLSNELGPDGKPVGVVDAGDFFHSDMQFSAEPVTSTILHAIVNPSRGGDTEFCNMHLVYDTLPGDVRARVEGRFGVHHPSKLRNPRVTVSSGRPDAKDYYASTEFRVPEMNQPVVRTHPVTGRRSLYVSPRFTLFIDGMERAESDELLDAVFALMQEPRFRYRHRWLYGDIVMWDNRCLNHRATGGYVLPDVRRMHRTQVRGAAAFYRPG
jgi:taurine dioxygenase